MTRTSRNQPSGRGKTNVTSDKRQGHLSRTLSKVLRHQAENEGIPITKDGWVKLSDLFAWHGLSDIHKFNPPVTVSEVMDVIKDDGIHGKGRFGLKLVKASQTEILGIEQVVDDTQQLSIEEQNSLQTLPTAAKQANANSNSKNSMETLAVIAHQAEHPDLSASAYLIRATQGHSIKAVESEGLLTPITLDDPSSIPDTVVHGTFYGAWAGIQSTGGLKPMSRNMVHFASGPSLTTILPSSGLNEYFADQPDQINLRSKKQVDDMLSQNKVISGMRWDAQILIYIDLKRLLQDVRDNGWDMKWWQSDNGVILSEGVIIPSAKEASQTADSIPQETNRSGPQSSEESAHGGQEKTSDQNVHITRAPIETKKVAGLHTNPRSRPGETVGQAEVVKVVPLEYFDAVVEIKAGIGLLWRAGQGVVRELPEHLKLKGVPRGKGLRGEQGKGGAQSKPRVRVERSTDLSADIDEGDH